MGSDESKCTSAGGDDGVGGRKRPRDEQNVPADGRGTKGSGGRRRHSYEDDVENIALEHLESMGFPRSEQVKSLLRQHGNSIEAVVPILVSSQAHASDHVHRVEGAAGHRTCADERKGMQDLDASVQGEWFFQVDSRRNHTGWERMDASTELAIEAVHAQHAGSFQNNKYRFDLRNMEQVNLKTKRKRKIRRRIVAKGGAEEGAKSSEAIIERDAKMALRLQNELIARQRNEGNLTDSPITISDDEDEGSSSVEASVAGGLQLGGAASGRGAGSGGGTVRHNPGDRVRVLCKEKVRKVKCAFKQRDCDVEWQVIRVMM